MSADSPRGRDKKALERFRQEYTEARSTKERAAVVRRYASQHPSLLFASESWFYSHYLLWRVIARRSAEARLLLRAVAKGLTAPAEGARNRVGRLLFRAVAKGFTAPAEGGVQTERDTRGERVQRGREAVRLISRDRTVQELKAKIEEGRRSRMTDQRDYEAATQKLSQRIAFLTCFEGRCVKMRPEDRVVQAVIADRAQTIRRILQTQPTSRAILAAVSQHLSVRERDLH